MAGLVLRQTQPRRRHSAPQHQAAAASHNRAEFNYQSLVTAPFVTLLLVPLSAVSCLPVFSFLPELYLGDTGQQFEFWLWLVVVMDI